MTGTGQASGPGWNEADHADQLADQSSSSRGPVIAASSGGDINAAAVDAYWASLQAGRPLLSASWPGSSARHPGAGHATGWQKPGRPRHRPSAPAGRAPQERKPRDSRKGIVAAIVAASCENLLYGFGQRVELRETQLDLLPVVVHEPIRFQSSSSSRCTTISGAAWCSAMLLSSHPGGNTSVSFLRM